MVYKTKLIITDIVCTHIHTYIRAHHKKIHVHALDMVRNGGKFVSTIVECISLQKISKTINQ